MASLFKKIIRGNAYYYARVSQRVDGKPKIVSQTYLGRADRIIEKLQAPDSGAQPREAVVREFGACAALLALARRLRLAEHMLILCLFRRKSGVCPHIKLPSNCLEIRIL